MIISSYNSLERPTLLELLSPCKIIGRLQAQRSLLKQFTQREVQKRYQGTLLGLFWSFFTPLLMLAVYTVVFGFIFQGSYQHSGETKMQFVLGLFCGTLLWDLIANSIVASPMIIVQNRNLATKVIFPLEILPIAMIASNFTHTLIGFIPLLLLIVISQGVISCSALSLFFIFIPVLFYCLGVAWIISALGVFLRDIGAMMPAVITVFMFMSAIFFPMTAIPVMWRWVVMFNPAAVLISMARDALIFGEWIDWKMYGIQLILSVMVTMIGYIFFMKVKPAFADVL